MLFIVLNAGGGARKGHFTTAKPLAAGAALVYALNPGWQAAEVIQHLKDSADKLASLALVCEDGNRR